MYTYPVILTPLDNGDVMAEFPDVPQALTYGANAEQALSFAQDALTEALGQYMEMRLDIPRPHSTTLTEQPEGQSSTSHAVEVAPMVGIKLCIYQTMREQSMSQERLARLLTCDARQVRRLLDIFHNSTIEQLTAALEVLGYKLEMRALAVTNEESSHGMYTPANGVTLSGAHSMLC